MLRIDENYKNTQITIKKRYFKKKKGMIINIKTKLKKRKNDYFDPNTNIYSLI